MARLRPQPDSRKPNRTTEVNPRRRKTCIIHNTRVLYSVGRGWKRCPSHGCKYTRR